MLLGIEKDSRLSTINGVKCLVEQQTNGPAVVDPAWAVLIQGGVVPQHGQEVEDDERKARQRNEVRRHVHREAVDDKVGVEGLENVFRHQGPVHGRVLVLLQGREVVLPHVHHLDRMFPVAVLLFLLLFRAVAIVNTLVSSRFRVVSVGWVLRLHRLRSGWTRSLQERACLALILSGRCKRPINSKTGCCCDKRNQCERQ